jgi:hypothetical protein
LGCGQKEEGQVVLVVVDYTGQQHLRNFFFLAGVVQKQEKNPERREDGRSKLKDKEQPGQSVVGFAGLASLKAQLFPQASVESSLTMNTTVGLLLSSHFCSSLSLL